MSPVFTARRRAEEFNLLVEDASTGDLRDARYVEFLELVGALRQTPTVEARPEFVASLRERLMAEADVALAKVPTVAGTNVSDRLTVAPRRTARERRFAVAVGSVAIIGATTSMAVASQSALPGDMLYPLKRAIENAHTGFSVDDSSKGSTLLANASGRLDEVDALTRKGDDDAATIADTLGTFSAQASEASDLLIADYQNTGHEGSIAELRDFTSSAMSSLSQLEAVVPEAARGALITAARVLEQIDTQAQSLCPDCGGAGIDILPPFVLDPIQDPFATVSNAFTIATPSGHKAQHPAKHHPQQGQQQPPTEPVDVTEPETTTGDVTDATSSSGGTSTGHQGHHNGPVSSTIGGLLGGSGGGDDTSNTISNTAGDVGGVLEDTGDAVGEVLGGVLGTSTP
jgi:hypothetical protein